MFSPVHFPSAPSLPLSPLFRLEADPQKGFVGAPLAPLSSSYCKSSTPRFLKHSLHLKTQMEQGGCLIPDTVILIYIYSSPIPVST